MLVALALAWVSAAGLPSAALADPASEPVLLEPEVKSMVDAYLRTYPEMSTERALANLYGQEDRIRLLEVLGERGDASFGGSWFDALTGIEHLATTDGALLGTYQALAADFGIDAVVHEVRFPAEELRVVSATINSGLDPVLGLIGANQSSVDFEQNAVLVTVTPIVYETRGGAAFVGSHSAIKLVSGSPVDIAEDACNSRYACGAPLRGGVVIDRVADTPSCSLGYTASATDGSRWAITAGHCDPQLNYLWRHGEQVIGPVRQTLNEAEIDVARIRIDNGYWRQAGGGYLYNATSPNSPLRITLSITNRNTIEVDEMVCLNARFSTLANSCGVITSAYGPRNMPTVDFDACSGDSGGAWTHRPPGGSSLWAYGVHHGSSEGTCHALFGYSTFTAVPDMNIVFPTIRIEIRP